MRRRPAYGQSGYDLEMRSKAKRRNRYSRLQSEYQIEKEKKQEQQRIDFFTAVSHELKTPVAIIKGELEGMIYEVGEYKKP